MGMCHDYNFLIKSNKVDIEEINKYKNENKDFESICNLINIGNRDKNIDLIISNSFKFLKIESFYLGLNSAEEIYNFYSKEFQIRGLSKEDSVHASLLFVFSDDCNYFVDYFPDRCSSEYNHVFKDEKKGLRYKVSNIKEFIEKNNICIINFKAQNIITFYELLNIIHSSGKWTFKNYDLEKNNCCHFCLYVLNILKAKLATDNIMNDIIFTKLVENKNEETINKLIPKIFLNYLKINNQLLF